MRGRSDDDQPNSDSDPVMEPNVRRQYKNGSRATRADFVDESQNEGSLWASDGQTNYYFTKNKIRGIGDILTINVEPDLVRDITTEARRTLSPKEREYELAAAQERIRAKTLGLPSPDGDSKDQVASSAAAPQRGPAGANGAQPAAAAQNGQPAPDIDIPAATYADVDVGKSLAIKAGDTMMGEITRALPQRQLQDPRNQTHPLQGRSAALRDPGRSRQGLRYWRG